VAWASPGRHVPRSFQCARRRGHGENRRSKKNNRHLNSSTPTPPPPHVTGRPMPPSTARGPVFGPPAHPVRPRRKILVRAPRESRRAPPRRSRTLAETSTPLKRLPPTISAPAGWSRASSRPVPTGEAARVPRRHPVLEATSTTPPEALSPPLARRVDLGRCIRQALVLRVGRSRKRVLRRSAPGPPVRAAARRPARPTAAEPPPRANIEFRPPRA